MSFITFKQALQRVADGTLNPPKVFYGDKQIDPVVYQLIVHKYYLGILAAGMKTKQVNLKYFKDFYELKGRTAKDIMPGFMAIYHEHLG